MKTHLNKQGRPACRSSFTYDGAWVITRKYAHVTCGHCLKIVENKLKRQRDWRNFNKRKIHRTKLWKDKTYCGQRRFTRKEWPNIVKITLSDDRVTCKNCLKKM